MGDVQGESGAIVATRNTDTRSTLSAASVKQVFSVIFPAMTGIMEGANLSGDLENPGRCGRGV